jgi:hypothetical protein
MSLRPQVIRNAMLRLLVGSTAALAVCGWVLSWLHEIDWLGPVAGVGIILLTIWGVRPACRFWPDFREGVLTPLLFPPFLILVILAVLAGLIYPPTMLDSLTYRLPRMWLWLQDHRILSYGSTNARIDYMPQTWGLATMPFLQAFGDKLVWFWTFCSWLALYLVVYDWSWSLNGNEKKSRYLAFFASSSTFAVLQATSSANDLFAAVGLVLALHFIAKFERSHDWREINWAVLSFALASGTKIHYSIFGLPLVLWFFLSPSKPWQTFRWRWTAPLLAVWLLCSPVPSFVLNENASGTWAGAEYQKMKSAGGPVWNVGVGTAMFLWQTPQPAVNPAALVFNGRLENYSTNWCIKKYVPKFSLTMNPVAMPDGAGLGTVTAGLMLAGALLAFRRRLVKLNSLSGWAALSGSVLLVVAMSQYVPGGTARTYTGFLFLTLPVVIAGWNLFSDRWLRWGMWLSFLTAAPAIVLEPSRPLWPAQWAYHQLSNSPHYSHLAAKAESYFRVPERAHAGEDLVQAIPESEPQVLVLVGDDWPLLAMFRPYWLGRDVLLIPAHSLPKKLDELGVNYVIVGGGGPEFYPELCDYLAGGTGSFQMVMTRNYVSKLARGAEPWTLYRRVGRPKPLPE